MFHHYPAQLYVYKGLYMHTFYRLSCSILTSTNIGICLCTVYMLTLKQCNVECNVWFVWTFTVENPGSNIHSTLLQFTQLYERIHGYKQWRIFMFQQSLHINCSRAVYFPDICDRAVLMIGCSAVYIFARFTVFKVNFNNHCLFLYSLMVHPTLGCNCLTWE